MAVATAERSLTKTRALEGESLAVARLLIDTFAILAAVALAFTIRFRWAALVEEDLPRFQVTEYTLASVLWLLGLLLALAVNRLYDEDHLLNREGQLASLFKALLEAAAFLSMVVFLGRLLPISRVWFGSLLVLSGIFIALARSGLRAFLESKRRSGQLQRSVIIVSSDRNSQMEDSLRDSSEFRVIASIPPNTLRDHLQQLSVTSVRRFKESPAILLRPRDFDQRELWNLVVEAGRFGYAMYLHSDVRSVSRARLSVRDIAGTTIVKIAPPRLSGFRAAQKRAFDVLGAALILIVTSPLLAVISLAIAVKSGFPVIFKQERVGLHGRRFTMYKFRSMHKAAEEGIGHSWARPNDPRRTRIGSFLRRYSLDELPQLWNVLKGDMSLVGPRPEMSGLVGGFSEEIQWYDHRHRIRPGLTGWAQAHGLRGNTSLQKRIEFDNWYIEHWRLSLDIKIIAGTFREMMGGI